MLYILIILFQLPDLSFGYFFIFMFFDISFFIDNQGISKIYSRIWPASLYFRHLIFSESLYVLEKFLLNIT